jgi:hypothetical protein
VLLALVTIAHPAAIHFKQPKGRERNTTPFIWLLATLIFLWVVEWFYITIRFDKIIHDDNALLVATPTFIVLVLQLSAILTLPSKKGAGKEMNGLAVVSGYVVPHDLVKHTGRSEERRRVSAQDNIQLRSLSVNLNSSILSIIRSICCIHLPRYGRTHQARR